MSCIKYWEIYAMYITIISIFFQYLLNHPQNHDMIDIDEL